MTRPRHPGPGRLARWLRRTLWALLGLVLVAGLGMAAALWLALEDRPAVAAAPEIGPADLVRALRLLRAIDPRRQPGQAAREVTLSQREVELLIAQFGQRRLPGPVRVTLSPATARVQGGMPVQAALAALSKSAAGAWLLPLLSSQKDRWLNVDLALHQTAALPRIERLSIGRLPVPAWLAEWALPWWLSQHVGADELALARDVVQGLMFDAEKLTVRYVWHAGTAGRLMSALVPQPQQEAMRAYLERLAGLRLKSVAGGRIPLVQVLPPVFELARQRSAQGANAAQENRAAILALAFTPFPRELRLVIPASRTWRLPPRWPLTLYGRDDFPLHFLISAALAVEAGGPLADAIGVFKEMLDTGDGSGFSFNDIAADQAGRRFGQRALADARRWQERIGQGVTDADLLPDVSDLPEFMRPAEFQARYGGVDAPAYRQQLADIQRRLDAMPLYR